MDFFGRTRHPYYIHAPDYRPTSAGIIAVYVLCHTINELGFEAYISLSGTTCDTLRAPLLTHGIMASHYKEGLTPISLSPETLNADPFDLPIKARWLLNQPGHLGGPATIPEDEILFHFDDWVLSESLRERSLKLRTPTFDTRIFTNHNNPNDHRRNGFAYYAHKFLAFGETVPAATQDWISLGQEIPRSKSEIANILKRSEALVCFEQSSLIAEALACGCPVLLVPSSYWPQTAIGELARHPGIALFDHPDALTTAKASIGKYPDMLAEDHAYCLSTIKQFIGITQIAALKHQAKNELSFETERLPLPSELWKIPSANRENWVAAMLAQFGRYALQNLDGSTALLKTSEPSPPETSELSPQAVQDWLSSRAFRSEQLPILTRDLETWTDLPSFQVLIRLPENDTSPLAQTLESLNAQLYNRWQVEVITSLPCPAGLEALVCLRWHTAKPDTHKSAIDFVVAASPYDLTIELPAGAILDPLCLWRIATEARHAPEASAFFVDDDVYESDGTRCRPRLKPGNNITWLQSMDLAGPLFIRRQHWREMGGASMYARAPWFDYLLRLQSLQMNIRHVADALISYPNAPPTHSEDCLAALLAYQTRENRSEAIIPATPQAWRTLPNITEYPPVTVALLSFGQLEFLRDCLESILQTTTYPAIEILVVYPKDCDLDFAAWITETQTRVGPILRCTPHAANSNSELSKFAASLSDQPYLVLMREDCLILQETWLEDLVRTILKPNVALVMPRLVLPGTGNVQNIGKVAGLGHEGKSPYAGCTHFSEPGYLDSIQVARNIQNASAACILVDRSAFQEAVTENPRQELGEFLCLRKKQLIYQPQVTIVHYGHELRDICVTKRESTFTTPSSWAAKIDTFWNPNLSLAHVAPTPETAFYPRWQSLPVNLPRIAARPVTNGQGDFRIISPLTAARNAGLILDCLWPQSDVREFSAAELIRLKADSLIVQNYLLDVRLSGLADWRRQGVDTLIVYALDDLCTEMPKANSLRCNVQANVRSRLKFALSQCDRLVVSTEFLADAYQHFISDIRVVPNRLEQRIWGSLQSRKQTSPKPRIGWAGGTTHWGDLNLLKDVITATHNEADWVFFGMCPEELRPLISEYHELAHFSAYPAKLASLNLDIAVAPLEMNRFNQGKSNLRLLEYGILGIPVVCTNITPYQNTPAKCVPNLTEAWIEALRERIHNPVAAQQEGQALQQWVLQNYIVENFHAEWLSAHLPCPPI